MTLEKNNPKPFTKKNKQTKNTQKTKQLKQNKNSYLHEKFKVQRTIVKADTA